MTPNLAPEVWHSVLEKMMLIRQFETRAEQAYLQGKVGGFFHSYIGQEAIQTAAVQAMGSDHWWATSYRCHALALLLGASPRELMAELFGRATGNARGRGGSMHFFTDRLLGGFGIVAGQVPIATGAAFSLKYRGEKKVAICFLGEGAVAQGSFHESLNVASLWSLPCIYVIENNHWGMGTAVSRGIAVEPIAEHYAGSYGINGYTLDGMNFAHCYAGFSQALTEVLATSRPVLIEAKTERFRGHSISDPALYRSKEALGACMKHDPIQQLTQELLQGGIVTEEQVTRMEEAQKQTVLDALAFADQSPWPDPMTLGEGVYAP